MPSVFNNDNDIKVIEYGDHCFEPIGFKAIWKIFAGLFKAA